MGAAFSRTLRSLQADSSRTVVGGLLLTLALLIPWLGWFFMARVPLYEASTTALLISETQVAAEFTPPTLLMIRPGQPAQLRLDGLSGAPEGIIPATVVGIVDERYHYIKIDSSVQRLGGDRDGAMA